MAKGVNGCGVRCTCLARGCCVHSKVRVAKCGCSFTKAPNSSCKQLKRKKDWEKDRVMERSPPDQSKILR